MTKEGGVSGDIQRKNKDPWIKPVPISPFVESTFNVDGEKALIVDKVVGSCHDESMKISQSQNNTLSKFFGGCVVAPVDIAGSDPIASFGPEIPVKPKKSKQVIQIYENLKIPFAPSYFSALLQSQENHSSYPLIVSPARGELEKSYLGGSGDSILCCDSITDSGVKQRNNRIWKSIEGMPRKVWKSIKELGVEGDEGDEVFEGIVRDIETREHKCFEAGKAK